MPSSTAPWRRAETTRGLLHATNGMKQAVPGRAHRAALQPGSAAVVLLLLAMAAWQSPQFESPGPGHPSSGAVSVAQRSGVERPAPTVNAFAANDATPAGRTLSPPATQPASEVLTRVVDLYELAGTHYGINPLVLRALHAVESSGAGDGCLANLEGSGTLGPFQFMPTTFNTYGVDADGDGSPSICGFVDSLFSAARYLRAPGADASRESGATRRALERYGTDAALVLQLAR